jgi:hypothetical protein
MHVDSPDASPMPSDSSWRRPPACFDPPSDDRVDRHDVVDAPDRRAVSFAREKFVWLDQVRADPELTPLAFMLAYVIANLVNEREGYAWPTLRSVGRRKSFGDWLNAAIFPSNSESGAAKRITIGGFSLRTTRVVTPKDKTNVNAINEAENVRVDT